MLCVMLCVEVVCGGVSDGGCGGVSDVVFGGFGDGQTDGQTDRQTDERTLVVVESLSRLKKENIVSHSRFLLLYLILNQRQICAAG